MGKYSNDYLLSVGTALLKRTTLDLANKKPPLQVTASLPLDLYISTNMKGKILTGKYINLADLLEKDPTIQEAFNLSITRSGHIGQSRNNRITSFEQWDNVGD